ncbi:hypothetical protein BC826DRAFT_465742 [Russula brevipes]|nr:hypothetical protein BC826DRAFT_465742 [Russula brevipes]
MKPTRTSSTIVLAHAKSRACREHRHRPRIPHRTRIPLVLCLRTASLARPTHRRHPPCAYARRPLPGRPCSLRKHSLPPPTPTHLHRGATSCLAWRTPHLSSPLPATRQRCRPRSRPRRPHAYPPWAPGQLQDRQRPPIHQELLSDHRASA